jgi:exopolyphosphatase/guanosine-5'-triphosphate,3'-diphosphate pyrophosphatase
LVLLVGLLLLLALTLSGPVRRGSRAGPSSPRLAAESTAYDQRIADLEAQLARQSDPDWSARQARERLAYVLPGDRLVVVVDGEAAEGDAGTLPEPRTPRPGPGTRSCWARSPRPIGERPRAGREHPDHAGGARRRRPAAGTRAPRGAGGGAPLPVRPARRGADLAPAGGRHAVPDAVLPDLPAGVGGRQPPGVGRPDAGVAGRPRHRRRPAAAYRAAHEAYLAERDALGELPTRATAGGMPDRVKCLHALAGHALAAGPGVNPVGDRAVAGMGEWWAAGPCAQEGDAVTRAAAIDCGTNSIRLLVADVPPEGAHTDLLRRMEVVRLGQGVDATGRLAPEAIERTRVVLAEYAVQARDLGATAVRMVATSATRDAANRADFEAMVVATLGRPPDVVPGRGGAAVLPRRHRLPRRRGRRPRRPATAPAVPRRRHRRRLDGVRARRRRRVRAARSVDVGCVRLTERHLHGDPPTPTRSASAEADIRAALAEVARRCRWGDGDAGGPGGSVTTVAALALRLPAYDAEAIHGSRIPVSAVRAVTAGLLTGPTRRRRAAYAVMHPGPGRRHRRPDRWSCGCSWTPSPRRRRVSEHDILDGIGLQLARGQVRGSSR